MWLEVVSRDTNGFLMTADQVTVQSQPVGTAEFSTDPLPAPQPNKKH